MKYIVSLITILLLGSFLGKGQPVNLILNTPETGNQDHTARQSITLTGGYLYTPGAGVLTARIVNNTGPDPITYDSTPIDPQTRSIHTTSPYLVGTTSGAFTVNAMGAATYTIPFDLPAGVNGLKPEIALTYSSMNGSGIAGFGWQLSGISAITRAPQTVYQDNLSRGVNADIYDRYALDGQRLVCTSGTYGSANSVYGTEVETFSRVTALGSTGNGPEEFKVETKNGLSLQYGHTTDSRQKLNESVTGSPYLCWYVSSVSDLFGNQMTFSYMKQDGNIYPEHILYGPNQVNFYYKQRSDSTRSYFKGEKFYQKLLLEKVEILYNNSVIKTYQLTYNYLTNNYYGLSALKEVTEYGLGGSSLNSTAFSYQQPGNAVIGAANWHDHDFITSDSRLFTGDFNGDGFEDIAAVRGLNTRLYFNNKNGGFYWAQELNFPSNEDCFIADLIVTDLNGDNNDDLITVVKSGPYYSYYWQVSNGSILTYYQSFALDYLDYNHIYDPKFEHRISDFDGDGFNDFLIMNPSNNSWEMFSFTESTINSDLRGNHRTGTISSWGDKVYIADFNGDGKSDVWVFSNSGLKIYTLDGNYFTQIGDEVTSITSQNNFNQGDFNGDGKTDLFVYDDAIWKMYLSTGTGFDFRYIDVKLFNLKNNVVYARDFNGDGRTDLLALGKDSYNNPWQHYLMANLNGNDFSNEIHYDVNLNKDYSYILGDFNGNGKADVLATNTTTGYYLANTTGNTEMLLKYIGNGLGQETRVDYGKLTDGSVYTKNGGSNFPVFEYQGPVNVVTGTSVNNGYGPTMSYKYGGLKVHRQGKGFLCFGKISATQGITDIVNESNYSYDTEYHMFFPKLTVSVKRKGANNISIISNEYSIKDLSANGNKRYFPYISSTTDQNILTSQTINYSYDYDNFGNLTTKTKSRDFGNSTETTTNTVVNITDASNWLLGRVTNSSTTYTGTGNPITKQVNRTYSATSNHVETETYFPSTASELSKSYEYYSNGNLKKETVTGDAVPRITQYEYSGDNIRVSKITDPLGHQLNRGYNGYGLLESETDYLNNTVYYSYDNFGRQTQQSNPDGSVGYSSLNWNTGSGPTNTPYCAEKSGNDGSLSRAWYDALGQEVRSDVKGFDGNMIAVTKTYNPVGELTSVSEPNSSSQFTTYTYDDYRRPSVVNRFTGSTTTYGYSDATITETTDSRQSTKTYNSDGTLAQSADPIQGTVAYSYYPDGKVHTVTVNSTQAASMSYDDAGNQTQLVDQSAGTINYTYTKFGELKTQTNARGDQTIFDYNQDGTLNTKTSPEGQTGYTYNGYKQLTDISSPGSSRHQSYDSYGRIQSISETINGSPYQTTFAYDGKGRLLTRTHPSGVVEENVYNDNTGYLTQVKANGQVVWTINSMDERQNIRTATYGSSLGTTRNYNNGFLTSIVTGSVQNDSYSFDQVRGNLSSRSIPNRSESFSYDNLERLTDINQDGTIFHQDYDPNGNITSKTDFGASYVYNDSMEVNTSPENYASDQEINYTSFEKVSNITEGSHYAEFVYNPDEERSMMTVKYNGSAFLTRIYAGSRYMKETLNGVTKEYTYIGGDAYSAPVVIETSGGTNTTYFLLRDHLGSVTHVTNSSGSPIYNYSFDAWGRQRDSYWALYPVDNEPWLFMGRGFTGHEHLPWFNLINMNGRLYDPVVGRFLSPDNFVQDADNTQNYNRYAYCINNPLKYNDPSGKLFGIDDAVLIYIAMSAIQQGMMAGAQAEMNGNSFSSGFWKGTAIGLVSGAITQGVGSLTSNMGIINQSLIMGGTAFATTGLGSVAQNGNWDMKSSLIAGGMAFGMGMLQLTDNGDLNSGASTESSGYDPANPGGDLGRVKSRAKSLGIEEGHYGLGELTTNDGPRQTLNRQTGHFINPVTGNESDGYTFRKAWSWSKNSISMHISPYASQMSDWGLDGVLRHEGTHMYHFYLGLDQKMSAKEFENRTEYCAYTQMKNEMLRLPANIQSSPGYIQRLNEINNFLIRYPTSDSRFYTPSFMLKY